MAEIHGQSFPRGWSEGEMAALIAKPTTVVVSDDQGFALVQVVAPEAELLTVAIAPAMRGKGHGTALLARALQAAERAGARTLTLEVDATNAAALALYHASRFTRVARRSAYYAHPDGTRTDALVMARALGDRNADA